MLVELTLLKVGYLLLDRVFHTSDAGGAGGLKVG
jgi:hypothetical protein